MEKSLRVAALLLIAAAALLPTAYALSWPLCENGGTSWVTQRPSVDPRFPGASLFFGCDGGLNILGDSVEPCLNNGTVCTQAVNDAICKTLGYDNAYGNSVSSPAAPGEVVRSLTGEYCLRKGTYSATLPDNLASMPGEPCLRINQIACVRTLQHMADSMESIIMEAVMAPNPASGSPAASTAPEAVNPADSAAANPTAEHKVAAADGPSNGGRKMKL